MGVDLPVVWAAIILFAVMMYVAMDGFDLGIGLLLPFATRRAERDVMVDTVAPVWDGNETWLVLGGAGLLAAFPNAYAAILSALHIPIVLMLVGLVFRGVAFEFRVKARPAGRPWWDAAFAGGSALATFCQGAVLGAYLDGVPRTGGGSVPLGAFAVFTGLGLMVAYALLGATWLVLKTEGALQQRMRRLAERLTWALLAVIVVLSVWCPLAHEQIARRWFSWPDIAWFAPVPLLVALASWRLLRALRQGRDGAPFLLALGLLLLGYTGLGISLWPNVIPPDVTIREAAGPPQSLGFTMVGALLIIPVTLAYTAFSYWVFRGKVRPGAGDHR
jgi:cytochrome d ubiquinol oxidase subunit II